MQLMRKADFKDLPGAATMPAANAVHLATMLKDNPYPGISGG